MGRGVPGVQDELGPCMREADVAVNASVQSDLEQHAT